MTFGHLDLISMLNYFAVNFLLRSHLIVVEWERKEIPESHLKEFINTKCHANVTIHYGRKKYKALIEFPEDKKQSKLNNCLFKHV